jgi:hypothetical protein
MATLLHTSINAFSTLQSHLSTAILTHTDLPFLLGFGVLALVILIITRGRLGYTQELLNIALVENKEISK